MEKIGQTEKGKGKKGGYGCKIGQARTKKGSRASARVFCQSSDENSVLQASIWGWPLVGTNLFVFPVVFTKPAARNPPPAEDG